ncbi:MAG TPA: HYR domain-containing protein [Blastocatellia bacterium]|nr:HYR domain-containing protein [Blastocatellia bacterium]
MTLSKNFAVKVCGLLLAIAGLACWQIAKTPTKVHAQFGDQASHSLATSLPVASSAVSAAPAGTQTFCSGSGITFNNNLPPALPPYTSTPYPSTVNVSGMTGTVTKVIVELQNLSHTFPDDIDLLLVGPTGAKTILMSDVGGGTDAINLNITLDDTAATLLPDLGPLVSGVFKPTNPSALIADVFPSPAPAGPYGSTLSVFDVSSPNGTWSLYAVDDTLGDVGTLGNWCLTITTEDTAPCTLTCPPNVTQANDANQCGAASVTYPAPTTTGVCGTVECSPPSGSFFFVGTTTVTCTSATGSQCSFTVTVNNVDCPNGDPDTLSCNPTSISLPNGGGTSPYPSSIGVSGLTGTISKVTVTLNNINHTFPDDIDVLLVGPTGANAIIMSDAGGGTDANNVTLTFDDAAASSLSDTAALVSGTFKPTSHAPADTFPPPASTPSGGSALSVFNGTNPNGVWNLYVVDDTTGDFGSISGGWCLTITRVNICTITCPANVTVSNDPNQCGAVVNYPAAATTGDCGTVTCLPASGSFFPVGTTSVTCTTTSGPSCSFTVTVNDTQAPTVTCPTVQPVPAAQGQCSAPVTYTATATDNCPGVSTVTCTPASGAEFPVGTTTVNCSATDAAGNPGSCMFTVTVVDEQDPIVTCPANISLAAPSGQCATNANYTATATDNCPGVGAVTCAPSSGSSFPVGTTTVTCTATDAAGNEGSCSFTVTVTDNQNPVVTCPADKNLTAGANCTASTTYTATATDNCPGVGAPTCSPPSGSSFPLGTTTVTCTATDASGNQASCSFTVTVIDTTPPVITCPANISMDDNALGACGALINPGTPTATDNCGIASVVGTRSDSAALNALYPLGTTIITWKATDTSGNFTTCQQIIIVTNPSPVVTITGPPSGSIFAVNGSVPFTATFTDNLGDTHTAQWMFDAITASAPVVEPTSSTPGSANLSFTFTNSGVYLVSLKIVDECGNITIANTVNGEPAMVVIFDPDGEFVTGGGWITSPVGAYPANPTFTGKAHFGFNAKYHNGESTPRGETQFKITGLNFHSTSYEWLVIVGQRFQFKGSGKVNNSGNYGFLLTGIDGSPDKFRMKIWDKNNGNAIVYDNQMGDPDSANPTTVLGGGNLVIHH